MQVLQDENSIKKFLEPKIENEESRVTEEKPVLTFQEPSSEHSPFFQENKSTDRSTCLNPAREVYEKRKRQRQNNSFFQSNNEFEFLEKVLEEKENRLHYK